MRVKVGEGLHSVKYWYAAKLVRVIDGDTIVVDLDLGIHITVRETLRLFGINAPEKRGTTKLAGLDSMDYLVRLLQKDGMIIQTIKDKRGKYGRYLAKIFIGDVCVNDAMVNGDQAEYVNY
jgi:micrococcal nuclease